MVSTLAVQAAVRVRRWGTHRLGGRDPDTEGGGRNRLDVKDVWAAEIVEAGLLLASERRQVLTLVRCGIKRLSHLSTREKNVEMARPGNNASFIQE